MEHQNSKVSSVSSKKRIYTSIQVVGVNPSFLVGPTHGIFAAEPLLQHEAELSNEAGEGEGAKGVDAVHVLQDALLLFLGGVDRGCKAATDICSSCFFCTFPSATASSARFVYCCECFASLESFKHAGMHQV